MEPECILAPVKEEKVEYPSVPPGFKSPTSFTLKRIDDSEVMSSEVASGSRSILVGTEGDIGEDANLTKFLRSRPWINYSVVDDCKEEDSKLDCDVKKLTSGSLPKEVLHGCSEQSNSKKVEAKWNPEDACRPVLEEAPVFQPTEEEFKDALKYIATIRPQAEKYGICRIVPPPSWNPPSVLKETGKWGSSKFATRIQKIDKLQKRDSTMEMTIHEYLRKKKRKIEETGMQCTIANGNVIKPNELECNNEPMHFGFEPGPFFTLEAFQKYADEFKSKYFVKDNNIVIEGGHESVQERWQSSVEEIEGEYWRIIEKPTEEIEVLCGADVDTGVFGSGFPKVSSSVAVSDPEEKYLKSDWNLNNFSKLPDSMLSFEKVDMSGVLVPWLYVGMCFSSFCWCVEKHYLYSINYMHWGDPKVWYGVPGVDALKLEDAMKKHFPDLFIQKPDLLHNLVTQLSPSILTSEGVPVYRCVQNPKEFVLTFPGAYHSGFSCGFNYGETVNVAPLDWFPYGQNAVELYREQNLKPTISHDKLLFGAARETVRAQWEIQLLGKNTADNLRWKNVCGKEGVLAKALKQRVEMERDRRDSQCFSFSMKMDNAFDPVRERECTVCLYDLHLSAVGCRCCPDKFACLYHAKQLCDCPLSEKTFLFRHTISDLNVLVEALEGKLSAIYKWAKLDLGLAVSSFVSKDKSLPSRPDAKPFNSLEGIKQEGRFFDAVTSNSISPRASQGLNFSTYNVKGPTTPNMGSFFTEHQQVDSNEKKPMASTFQKEVHVNESVGGETNTNRSFSPGKDKIVILGDDEDPVTQVQNTTNGGSSQFTRIPEGLANNVCNLKEQILKPQQFNMSGMSQTSSITHDVRKVGSSLHTTHQNLESSGPQTQQPYGSKTPSNESSDDRTGSPSDLADVSPSIVGCSSRAMNKKFYPLKGPRGGMSAKRMNSVVESLELGVVRSGKFWSSSWAIYPRGFKSRVSYLSVLEPETCCYYVSEIFDAGMSGPLFMVTVEACPSEVFIHTSITKCWDMVRDRVNEEISRLGRLGRLNLPPQGSIDGHEMFGLTSPEIIKRLEAMDPNRVCTEYWRSRPDAPNKAVNGAVNTPQDKVILNWLFKKANVEELYSLQRVINSDSRLLNELLDEEIKGRRK